MHTIPTLFPRIGTPEGMNFSIGGWDPFSLTLADVVTGVPLGTVNGTSVYSGGFHGTFTHILEVARGVSEDLLGTEVGGILSDFMEAIYKPIVNLSKWCDRHWQAVALIIIIVAMVIISIYCPVVWAFMGEISSAVMGAGAEAGADVAVIDVGAGDIVAGEVVGDVAAEVAGDVAVEAGTDVAVEGATDVAVESGADVVASTGADVTTSAAPSLTSQAGKALESAAINAGAGIVVKDVIGAVTGKTSASSVPASMTQAQYEQATGTQVINFQNATVLPSWALPVGVAALVFLLVRK